MVTTVNVRASSRSLRDFAKCALPVHVQRRPAKTDIAFRRKHGTRPWSASSRSHAFVTWMRRAIGPNGNRWAW